MTDIDRDAGQRRADGGDGGRLAFGRADDPSMRLDLLMRTVEAEIIPRLRYAHGNVPRVQSSRRRRKPTRDDVHEFTRLATTHDMHVLSSFVDVLRVQGVSLEDVMAGLLAPAARHLGELWATDLCDFAEVTLGVARMQQLLRQLGSGFETEIARDCGDRRILLLPVCGECHTLGISMVADYFRRAGWDAHSAEASDRTALRRLVSGMPYDVVGISVACDVHFDRVGGDVAAVRAASRNPDVNVLVGGPVFDADPSRVIQVGADGSAPDGRRAVALAESMVKQAHIGPL